MFTRLYRLGLMLALTLALTALTGAAQAQNPTIIFDNTTNDTNFGVANNFAATINGNTISTMVADDIIFAPGYVGRQINGLTFTVVNFDTSDVTARARVRFYDSDGASGGPGTYLGGLDFTPTTYTGGGTLDYFDYTAPSNSSVFTVPISNKIWAGIVFDDNNGTTGATIDQINSLGQGLFDPPTVGTSSGVAFGTNDAGSFDASNPAGSTFDVGSPTSFGWTFTVSPAAVPEPGLLLGFGLAFGMGGVGLLARRRKIRGGS